MFENLIQEDRCGVITGGVSGMTSLLTASSPLSTIQATLNTCLSVLIGSLWSDTFDLPQLMRRRRLEPWQAREDHGWLLIAVHVHWQTACIGHITCFQRPLKAVALAHKPMLQAWTLMVTS